MWRKMMAAVVLGCVLGNHGVALAAPERESSAAQLGWGLTAVLANVFYVPAKLTYAGLGGLTGGLAFVLTAGNDDVASKIWNPSVGGTYVLSPEMVRGKTPIYFSGESGDD